MKKGMAYALREEQNEIEELKDLISRERTKVRNKISAIQRQFLDIVEKLYFELNKELVDVAKCNKLIAELNSLTK